MRHAPASLVYACLGSISVPALAIASILHFLTESSWGLDTTTLFWTFLAALAFTTGVVSYLIAMTRAEASFVLGITASYPVILQFVATFFLEEALVPTRVVGSVLVALGVSAIGFSKSKATKDNSDQRRNIGLWLLIILSTLCWGIYGLFDKQAVEAGGAIRAFMGKCLWDILFVLIFLPFLSTRMRYYRGFRFDEKKGIVETGADADIFDCIKSKPLWFAVTLSALGLNLGSFTYMLALTKASASYVVAITGCYPIIMYLLALWLLKEPFSKIRCAGIALVAAGGILTQSTCGQ